MPETLAGELVWKGWICLDHQTSYQRFTSRRLSHCLSHRILTSSTPKLSPRASNLLENLLKSFRITKLDFQQGQLIPWPYIIEEILNAEAVGIIATFKNRNKLALP